LLPLKNFPKLRIGFQIEIGKLTILFLPEMRGQPCLSDLARAVQDQRFSIGGCFPLQEFLFRLFFSYVSPRPYFSMV